MLDEQGKRGIDFVHGWPIRLADGQEWTLASLESKALDPTAQSLLQGLQEADSPSELLRAEFALSIELLTRNYELDREDLQLLFDFAGRSADLRDFQVAMHRIAIEFWKQSTGDQPC